MKVSVWNIIKLTVNRHGIATVVTRRELIKNVSIYYQNSDKTYVVEEDDKKSFSESTVDATRNQLTRVGFLKKTKKSGMYRIVKHIPLDYSLSKLKDAYIKSLNSNKTK